ncbi:class D beta-lactamase [Brucella sp. TWI559]
MQRTIKAALGMAGSAFCMMLALQGQASAKSEKLTCMIILNANNGDIISKEGDVCDTRNSPASTFKVPLALMGFESGILEDAHTPSWPYKEGYPAWRESWRQSVDPTYWEDQSVVWFSQELTRKLGKDKFQKYTDQLNYGNRDLSGDRCKNNGLLRSWISSSLQISPNEQADFLMKMVNYKVPFSEVAITKTMEILPSHQLSNGWMVHGKTGSAFETGPKGKPDRRRQFGWYVGWAEKGDQKVVFVRLNRNVLARKGGMGSVTREEQWAILEKTLQ